MKKWIFIAIVVVILLWLWHYGYLGYYPNSDNNNGMVGLKGGSCNPALNDIPSNNNKYKGIYYRGKCRLDI